MELLMTCTSGDPASLRGDWCCRVSAERQCWLTNANRQVTTAHDPKTGSRKDEAARCDGVQVLRHNPVEVSSYSASPAVTPPSSYPLVVDLVTARGKARAMAEYRDTRSPELCAWLEGFAEQLNTGEVEAKTDSVGAPPRTYAAAAHDTHACWLPWHA